MGAYSNFYMRGLHKVTAAIKESLSNLNTALQSLEGSASGIQDNLKRVSGKRAPTSDLFSVPNAPSNNIDTAALASRLDGAIAKVEKLLQEGE